MASQTSNSLLLLLLSLLANMLKTAHGGNLPVTCGSSIKLQHVPTKYRLHSHEVSYSRGSQQQSVTAYPTGDDGNSLWLILGTPSNPCVPGDVIKKGQAVRMQHIGTRKWLHSHLFHSPLSGNLEVSAFGSDGDSDTGDVWLVEWDGKHKQWKQDTKILSIKAAKCSKTSTSMQRVKAEGVLGQQPAWVGHAKKQVRFKHQDTGAYLYSHDMKFGNPIAGQQEVCATERKDKNAEWQAAEGVYFPPNESKNGSDKTEL